MSEVKCSMPDCLEMLDAHAVKFNVTTQSRLGPRIKNLEICKKCARRNPLELLRVVMNRNLTPKEVNNVGRMNLGKDL